MDNYVPFQRLEERKFLLKLPISVEIIRDLSLFTHLHYRTVTKKNMKFKHFPCEEDFSNYEPIKSFETDIAQENCFIAE